MQTKPEKEKGLPAFLRNNKTTCCRVQRQVLDTVSTQLQQVLVM
jgi:hypothetical protein